MDLLTHPLIITLIAATLGQVIAFVVWIIKFNTKFQIWKTQSMLEIEAIKIQVAEAQKNWDSEMIEMKTDLEDHKISYEKRFSDFSEKFYHHIERFCDESKDEHNMLKNDIGDIKNAISKMNLSLGELKGSIDTHIANGKK